MPFSSLIYKTGKGSSSRKSRKSPTRKSSTRK